MAEPWKQFEAPAKGPWDSYTPPEAPKEMGWGEYLGRGASDALPLAAGVIGGTVGGLPGGALGYAGGKQAKGLINHYAFGDELRKEDPITQVTGDVGEGLVQEMVGPALKAVGKIPAKIASTGKRNIVMSKVIDELSSIRKTLPEAPDIDALISEFRGVNKVGKVNSSEFAGIKDRLKSVLDSEDTGPNLRRAVVLAQDAANGVKIPDMPDGLKQAARAAKWAIKKGLIYGGTALSGMNPFAVPIVGRGIEKTLNAVAPPAAKGLLRLAEKAGNPIGQKVTAGLLRAANNE